MHQAMVALDSKHDMTKAEWRYLQYHAFNDLRERLAQPEQEPVAWIEWDDKRNKVSAGAYPIRFEDEMYELTDGASFKPLYTAPQPQQEQEPVAIVVDAYDTPGLQWFCQHPPKRGDRLYTAPQPTAQREWQGLFFDAVYEAWHSAGMDVLGGDWNTFASKLEEKLKETK
jgi:hypothetical protein